MKPLDKKPSRALVSILFVLLQACSTLVPVPTASPSPIPEEPRVSLSQLVTLSSISFKEEGQFPAYSITAQTPKFSGSEDERVQTFNQAVFGLVQAEIDYFRKNLLAQMPSVPVSGGSFFQAQYSVIFQNGNLWSLKFLVLLEFVVLGKMRHDRLKTPRRASPHAATPVYQNKSQSCKSK